MSLEERLTKFAHSKKRGSQCWVDKLPNSKEVIALGIDCADSYIGGKTPIDSKHDLARAFMTICEEDFGKIQWPAMQTVVRWMNGLLEQRVVNMLPKKPNAEKNSNHSSRPQQKPVTRSKKDH